MLVGSRQKLSKLSETPSFMINDHPVMQVSTAKSDQNLSWECHIQSICKKIASALGAIKRIRHLIPFNVLINVYDSLIQPHLITVMSYGATAALVFPISCRGSKIVQPVF